MQALTAMEGMLEKALAAALHVDRVEVLAEAAALREQHPDEDRADLARRVFLRGSWKAALAGAATGLPASLATAVPAALVDAAAVLRTEVHAAAVVAVLYDPGYLDRTGTPWELLVPIFGASAVSQSLRRAGLLGAERLTRVAFHAVRKKSGLAAVRKGFVKVFGQGIGRRALTRTVPLVAAAVGGAWNLAEVRIVGDRVIAFFEEEYA